jgi:hypothetical protein
MYRAPRSTDPVWPTSTRPNNFIWSFSSELTDTRHGRYTRAGTRACSETSPFVAPCPPGSESRNTFSLIWIRADRLVGDTITDVGEWHTHPERRPSPSRLYLQTWRQVAGKNAMGTIVFLIKGYECWCAGLAAGKVLMQSRCEPTIRQYAILHQRQCRDRRDEADLNHRQNAQPGQTKRTNDGR